MCVCRYFCSVIYSNEGSGFSIFSAFVSLYVGVYVVVSFMRGYTVVASMCVSLLLYSNIVVIVSIYTMLVQRICVLIKVTLCGSCTFVACRLC